MNTRVGGWDGAPAISSIVEFWADVNQADVQEETTQDEQSLISISTQKLAMKSGIIYCKI